MGYCFSAIISHACGIMRLKNNQNVENLLLLVVSEDSGVFCSEYLKPFSFFKIGEEESKLRLQASIPKSTPYNTKWAVIIFHEWQINRKVKVPVLDVGGAFKDYADL